MSSPPITRRLLIELAGEAAHARGERYAREDRVEPDTVREKSFHATVHGTHRYRVSLEWDDGALCGDCDCPVGLDGAFCKHQVAAALCWSGLVGADAEQGDSKPRRKANEAAPGDSDEQALRRWLAELPHERLRDLVVDLAAQDNGQWRSLVARARFARAGAQELQKAVAGLIGRRRFLDYRACLAYVRQVAPLHELLAERLDTDPAAVLALAEYALPRLFAVYAEADDSAGALGDVLAGIAGLHRAAAQQARPPQDGFARRYFKLRLLDDWGLLGGLDDYHDVLGRHGLAVIESLAAAALDKLPPKPASRHAYDEHAGERYALERLLEECARHGGDVDSLLTRKARNMQAAHDYLELSRLCLEHGRERNAIEWLERGHKAHPADLRLIEALAAAWERDGLLEESVALRWRAFQQQPAAHTFLALRDSAARISAWPPWRERALTHIDTDTCIPHSARDTLRVSLHLAEEDIAAAWRIATQAQLPPSLWAALAPALERDNPEGALRAYRTLVQVSVERTERRGYREAIAWLRRMPPLHRRLGTDAAFATYLQTLRQTCRAKRTFIAMLDKAFATELAEG